jgi:hypothetical protein
MIGPEAALLGGREDIMSTTALLATLCLLCSSSGLFVEQSEQQDVEQTGLRCQEGDHDWVKQDGDGDWFEEYRGSRVRLYEPEHNYNVADARPHGGQYSPTAPSECGLPPSADWPGWPLGGTMLGIGLVVFRRARRERNWTATLRHLSATHRGTDR